MPPPTQQITAVPVILPPKYVPSRSDDNAYISDHKALTNNIATIAAQNQQLATQIAKLSLVSSSSGTTGATGPAGPPGPAGPAGSGGTSLAFQISGVTQTSTPGFLNTDASLSGSISGGVFTIALPTTGVTAGVYTSLNATVDAFGRITAAASGSAGGIPTGATNDTLYYTSSSAVAASAFLRNDNTHVYIGTATDYSRLWVPLSGSGGTSPAPQYECWTSSTLKAIFGYDSGYNRIAVINATSSNAFCVWDSGKMTIGADLFNIATNEVVIDPTFPSGISTTILHGSVASFFQGAHKDHTGTSGASATTGGLTFKDGLYTSGTATSGSSPTDYISCVYLQWLSTTTFTVLSGSAYVPASSSLVAVGSSFTVNPSAGTGIVGGATTTLANNTLYYAYIATASTITFSTTAPTTNYLGTAWEDGSGNRYIGCLRTDSSAHFINFLRIGNRVSYRANINAAPFILTTTLATVSPASVSCTSVVPPTSRRIDAIVDIGNPGSAGSIGFGTSDGVTPTATTGSPVYISAELFGATGVSLQVLDLNASQAFTHMENANTISILLQAYYEDR